MAKSNNVATNAKKNLLLNRVDINFISRYPTKIIISNNRDIGNNVPLLYIQFLGYFIYYQSY